MNFIKIFKKSRFFLFLTFFPILIFPVFSSGKYDSQSKNSLQDSSIKEDFPPQKYELKKPSGEKIHLKESWGYVMSEFSQEFSADFPITDVCFFAADFDCYGNMINPPKRNLLELPQGIRSHFVAICDSRSLTHFLINKEFGLRDKIVDDIVNAALEFDGIQLDFELVPIKDKDAFIDFIKEIQKKAPEKIISVCVPARIKKLTDEPYPYDEISSIADRVFVMAYDEHWSGSKPGPVASTQWCKNVLDFAIQNIPLQKLIMGLPFYGRTWTDKPHSGAWYFSGANRVMRQNNVKNVEYEDGIPKFSYTAQVNVTGYFNDAYSLVELSRFYENSGIQNLGFWRIGQEDPSFWEWIFIEN